MVLKAETPSVTFSGEKPTEAGVKINIQIVRPLFPGPVLQIGAHTQIPIQTQGTTGTKVSLLVRTGFWRCPAVLQKKQKKQLTRNKSSDSFVTTSSVTTSALITLKRPSNYYEYKITSNDFRAYDIKIELLLDKS